jgi:N-methylhydantoinase B
MDINPILLEVFKNRFASISEEMGVTLTRTAFSPNIKERRDLSCAVFDEQGEMVAQAAHIPVHLGSMPLSVQAAIAHQEMREGDMVILNDPFQGGTHLPDITIVAPVFAGTGRKPAFYVANRAHHSDVGGMSSGSMPLSTTLYQEGVIIPPLKIMRAGEVDGSLMALILNNVRTPVEREGDFAAQIMANTTGVRRIRELIDKYDLDTVRRYARGLTDYSETVTRKSIAALPDGDYEFTDYMDDDGLGSQDIPISLTLTVQGDSARLDFSRTADQVAGSINAVRSITLSAVLYVFRSLVLQDIPTNGGCIRPIEVITRKGSLVDARFPAPVAGGNVETSQRIVDVILGALSRALPERIPAASQGTMNNIAMGGVDERSDAPFSYYETLAGGMGASPSSRGESAVHSHMTNTLNTPIEALEHSYPLRVIRYGVRKESGGRGAFAGGDGMVREIEARSASEITVLSERRRRGPYGLHGGGSGEPGRNSILRDGRIEEMPGKFRANLDQGDRVRIETPGGGGCGGED